MIRLHFVVEGQTEETFVNTVLREHLVGLQVLCDARCVETGRRAAHKRFKGGLLHYGKLRSDLTRWMKEDRRADARFTTMFDLYALPPDFPGSSDATGLRGVRRAEFLERRLAEDLAESRLIPYLQVHEFEALILAEPSLILAEFPDQAKARDHLMKDIAGTAPEDVDDGETTAPSKRILDAFPQYEKVQMGTRLAQRAGLDRIRAVCPHFGSWLAALEKLAR